MKLTINKEDFMDHIISIIIATFNFTRTKTLCFSIETLMTGVVDFVLYRSNNIDWMRE